MTCQCGKNLTKQKNNITTFFKGEEFVVKDVPVYVCERGHTKMSRLTRVALRQSLQVGFDKGQKLISYLATNMKEVE